MNEPPDGHPPSPRSSTTDHPARFLFTVDGDSPRDDLKIACDLVADNEGELFVGAPIEVSEELPLDAEEPEIRGDRLVAKFALDAKSACSDAITPIREVVRVGNRRDAMVAEMVDAYGITTLIEESLPETGIRSIFDADFDEPGVGDTCDVLTVSVHTSLKSIDSILVPIATGPHSGLAIDTAMSLARQNDASVELVHVETAGASPDDRSGEQVLAEGIERTGDYDDVTRTLLESESVSREIVRYARDFDVTVLGAPRSGLLRRFVGGTIPAAVSENATGTVVTAHRAGVESSWLDRLI